jgi:hypothetical protein
MGYNAITPRYPRQPTVRRAAVARTHQVSLHSAPVGGLNYVDSFAAMAPNDALILENFIPRSYGCEIREGTREHCTGLPAQGETLLPYYAASRADSRLFLGAADGSIYNITNSATAPWAPAFTPTAQAVPGRFSGVNFATNGVHFLCIGSAGPGYITFDISGGWAQRVQGTAAGEVELPATAVHSLGDVDAVFSWKNQLILVPADSTEVYVLPVNQVAGTAALFDFGPLLRHGGTIAALAPWTIDAGDGLDDKLVIVSTQGDLLVYSGDGVTASNFAIDGRWFIGAVPIGRRFLYPYAGDLAVLSERGMSYLSEILRGEGFSGNRNVARKINPQLSKQIHETRDLSYWEIRYVPAERLLVINAPEIASRTDQQYAMDVNTPAWCTLGGMDMRASEVYYDALFFADSQNRVLLALESETDNTQLDGTPGTSITAEVQTSFQPLNGEPFRTNRFLQAFASFTAPDAPRVRAQINGDWSFTTAPAVPGLGGSSGARWDQAYWDQAYWSPESQTFKAWFGAEGIGYYASLRMNVAGYIGTAFISWGVVSEAGGIQ